ncbi:MAG: WD40 repeat domain-containing protein [Planctomycetes bacterium]|nr:WD40 repeat domain-containing protein [Planctomycetota bacterium]
MSTTYRLVLLIAFASIAGPSSAQEFRRTGDIAIGGGAGYSVAFMPDGKRVVVGGNHRNGGVLQAWEVADNKYLRDFKGHTDEVWAVAVSPDGKSIASGSQDKTARIWDFATGNEITQLPKFAGRVTAVAFSPDNKTLLAASFDKSAVLYDIEAKKVKFTLKAHTDVVLGVAFSPDGKTCATVGKDKTVVIWNPDTGKIVRGMKFPDSFSSVTFTPDSKKILFAGGAEGKGDHSIKMIDLTEAKGKALMFKGHENSVLALSLTKDGKTLASCGYEDKTVRVWDVATQTSKAVLKTARDANSVAISPDGVWLAVANPSGLTLWEKAGK